MAITDRWGRWVLWGTLVVLGALLSGCGIDGEDGSHVSLGENYTLSGGERRSGEQVILAFDIALDTGSMIEGNATLIGDTVKLGAEIDGDAVIVADTVQITTSAHVTGDMTVCADVLERNPEALIGGEFKQECSNSRRVSISNVVESGWDSWRESGLFRLSSAIIGSLFFGGLAALSTILFPRALECMSVSIRQAPFSTGGVGFLTFLLAIGLTVIYVMSLLLVVPFVLMPFVLVAWLLIGFLSLLGWVALAEPFGNRLLARLGIDNQPRMVAAAVGAVVLELLMRIWSVFWFTAWIGVLSTVILGSVGLGAVILTRAGTKPFPHKDTIAPPDAVVRLAE